MICEDLIGMSGNQKVKTMASARALLSSADRVNSLIGAVHSSHRIHVFYAQIAEHAMHLVSRTKL